jgi:hypothetical protein
MSNELKPGLSNGERLALGLIACSVSIIEAEVTGPLPRDAGAFRIIGGLLGSLGMFALGAYLSVTALWRTWKRA